MKKTLLALSVMIATGSASAAEIYGSDTTKVSLKGEVDAYLIADEIEDFNDADEKEKTKSNADVSTWAKIQLDAEHKVNETFTAFASFEIEGDDSYLDLDDVFVGLKTDTWGFAVGEVGDFGDSIDAIQKDDITNEGNYASATSHHTESKGKGISLKGEFVEGLTLVADVHTQSDDAVDNTYGISADYAFANYSIGASYAAGDEYTTNDDGDVTSTFDYSIAGVSVSAEFSNLYLAATYSAYEGVDSFGYWDTENHMSGDSYGVAASYQLDKTRLYSTYSFTVSDENTATGVALSEDLEVANLVVGVDYALMKNILVFAEYQAADYDDGSEKFDAYTATAGVYYSF